MVEDGHNKDKLAQLTRWYTNRNTSELVSFDEYIARMKPGQKHIYFLGGDNRETLQHSPLIEKLIASGYEVILGDDPLDETVFGSYKQYKEYRIINVARNDFKDPTKTDDTRREIKSLTKQFQPLIDYMGQELKDVVKDVKVSLRLVNNPVVIIADMMNDTPNK
jgi:HSP90 family molecular chaperone